MFFARHKAVGLHSAGRERGRAGDADEPYRHRAFSPALGSAKWSEMKWRTLKHGTTCVPIGVQRCACGFRTSFDLVTSSAPRQSLARQSMASPAPRAERLVPSCCALPPTHQKCRDSLFGKQPVQLGHSARGAPMRLF